MRLSARIIALALVSALSGCGGSVNLTCDDIRSYQQAAAGKRVQAPEDLDNLDPLGEVPLPTASPAASRTPGSPCIDRPPVIRAGNQG